jgi:hypothetical protein
MPYVPVRKQGLRLLALVVALLTSASIAPPAAGQAPAAGTADHEAQRKALYIQASDAARAGRWAAAKERLLAALAIRSSPKLLFSLAQAEEKLGQVASAQADYAHSIEGAANAGEGDVVQACEEAQRALSARVPHVRIVLSGASGASAALDDKPVAVGTAVAVDPGSHRLVVSAPGMGTVTTSVSVVEGQQIDVPVQMEPASASPSLAPAPSAALAATPQGPTRAGDDARASGASPWRTVGLVMAGVGVVGAGVGIAVALDAKSKYNRATGEPEPAQWNDSGSAVSEGNVASVVLGVGAAIAVAGVVVWLTAPSGTESTRSLAVGTNGRQVILQGSF